MPKASYGFFIGDLRNPRLEVSSLSVDAVDATLSIHHATPTLNDLERISSEIFRVLKPGGILHLGEGDVDMSYAERKMVMIGRDLLDWFRTTRKEEVHTVMNDLRDPAYPKVALFDPSKSYDPSKDPLPVGGPNFLDSIPDHSLYITVNVLGEVGEGLVIIKGSKPREVKLSARDAEILMKDLYKKYGYVQRHNTVRGGGFPLIGSHSEDKPMREAIEIYYSAILSMVEGHPAFANDARFHEHFGDAIKHEKANAQLGLQEHYIDSIIIRDILRRVGFHTGKEYGGVFKKHKPSPFYSIVAMKPK
jgi:hypothetical protein